MPTAVIARKTPGPKRKGKGKPNQHHNAIGLGYHLPRDACAGARGQKLCPINRTTGNNGRTDGSLLRDLFTSFARSGSVVIFTAIRRASSLLSSLRLTVWPRSL
jgi:hypothetical protein